MFPPFDEHPGLLFVAATLLPVASVVVLLLVGGLRNYLRPRRDSGVASSLFALLGGETPGRGAGWVATAAIGLAFVCSLAGTVMFLGEHHDLEAIVKANEGKIRTLQERELAEAEDEGKADGKKDAKKPKDEHREHEEVAKLHHDIEAAEHRFEHRWQGSVVWARLSTSGPREPEYRGVRLQDPEHGAVLRLGYRIDHLAAVMFVMVTFIATLIHLFSIGYMGDETQRVVEDHEVHTDTGHLARRGRFGRFFLFLSLFCFSMLNLVLADNLFQVFVSWELVGVCSYLLIGFYYERTSASNAANKAFITNRIGDAGFIIGLLILWTHVGTLNFQEIFSRLRAPAYDTHHELINTRHQILRGDRDEAAAPSQGRQRLVLKSKNQPGDYAVLMPRDLEKAHFHANDLRAGKGRPVFDNPTATQFGYMPYWMLVVAGLGIFLGCVGKSAQFPLHVWLPDAMEGPTPVSALIHAATMVAAGVYLVGRAFPIFTPEVLLTIAYTGAITLFVAATIAIVMTDIKKVLAYSTVSQLGYMMLALGVAGWAAGLFHLVTHAFFKALLFLGSGSVIYGCHHQQDMLKMGGLYPKMKITALTMLMGVLAIAGTPLFSGWYSKDAVLAHALGFSMAHPAHILLFLAPLVTAGITTFYMFRMWFMTFTGQPRDRHVYEHAHESPWLMTVPLVLLAILSVCVAWPLKDFPFNLADAEGSALEHTLHHAQPPSVDVDFGGNDAHSPIYLTKNVAHQQAGMYALGMVAVGLVFAMLVYYYRRLDPAEAAEQFPGVHRFLWNKWYFDELYSAVIVRPGVVIAGWCRDFDTRVIDGFVNGLARVGVLFSRQSGRFDNGIVDGLVNLLADVSYGTGAWLRNVQTGYLRTYVLFLALAAAGLWILLSVLYASG
jgi:NADH-quinone oxidoreductase subunit L